MTNVYLKNKIITNWFTEITSDLENIYDFNVHHSLYSLKNELDVKQGNSFVIIDIEHTDFKLFTQSFNSESNIKFIGIGFKKNVDEIIELINSNIYSFISFESTSLEVIKALKYLDKGKMYFCEETKDQIIQKYFESNDTKNLKITYKINEPANHQITNSLEIHPLTEKEKSISNLLVKGMSYKEIANVLGVTTFAINQNTKSIYKKLKVRSRSELSYKILN